MRIFFTTFSMISFLYMLNACSTYQAGVADLVITNAMVVDGSGNEAYKANLHIAKDKIIAIDKTLSLAYDSLKTINANGRVVSPGFIDLHSHGNPLTEGQFSNFLAMGVTTITLGQDGFSPNLENLEEWKNSVNRNGTGANIAMFIGHGTLRELAGVSNETEITPKQLSSMIKILETNLPHVFGMSTGLEYVPALYARENELLTLAKVVGKADKMIMSHMRNEDDDAIIASIQELLAQGHFARVHISHLKSVYGKGAARAEEILKVLYDARANGIVISADVYPYTASYTGIAIIFPDWAKTNEQLKGVIKSRRKELETFIRNKVNSRNGPESTLFGTEPYQGKTLKQVADEMNLPFEKLLIDTISPEGASGAYFVMNKELQDHLITDSLMIIASDGSPTSFHPRGHGTFAKLIEEYVVQSGKLSLTAAIKKVTGKPASILGLKNRGEIKVGNFADLVIFNPEKVATVANYGNPHQLAKGFDYVLVNGRIAIDNGQLSNELFGKVLSP